LRVRWSRYEVVEAEDGEQAIERTLALEPALIILDLNMPKLNGCEAAIALRKIPAFGRTPIVALTAAWSEAIPEQIAAAGFTGYLVKPIGPQRLRQCIASLL
jgi:two-component system chemotaxis response regulator CheY